MSWHLLFFTVERFFYHDSHRFRRWGTCTLGTVSFQIASKTQGCQGRSYKVSFCVCVLVDFFLRFVLLRSDLTFELSDTTRSFNVTVDHRRLVQHISASKAGTLNDKTTVRYDSHVCAVRRGLFKDFCFKVIFLYSLVSDFLFHYLQS